jgi:hypothetical protein
MREQQPAQRLRVLEQVKALDNPREQLRLAGVGGDRGVLDGADDLRVVAQADRPGAWRARPGAGHDWQSGDFPSGGRRAGDGAVPAVARLGSDDQQQVRLVLADRAIDPLGHIGGAVPVQPAVAVVRDPDPTDTEDRGGELDFPWPYRL